MIQGAPGLFGLLQVLLHDLDISEGTVALWEAGWAMAPAVIVAAEQLAFWVARHIAEGCLYKTPTQEFWQDILQTWEKNVFDFYIIIDHLNTNRSTLSLYLYT